MVHFPLVFLLPPVPFRCPPFLTPPLPLATTFLGFFTAFLSPAGGRALLFLPFLTLGWLSSVAYSCKAGKGRQDAAALTRSRISWQEAA